MLYTLSKAQYDLSELMFILEQSNEQNRVILWQDAVLLPLKYPQLFQPLQTVFALENDVIARGIQSNYPLQTFSLTELVSITEVYFPQMAL